MKKTAIILFVLSIFSCSNPFYQEIVGSKNNEFNYETTGQISFDIDTKYANVPLDLYYGENKRMSLVSGTDGIIYGETTLPTYVDEVILKTNYLGFPSEIIVLIEDGSINYTYFSTQSRSTNNISTSRGGRNKNYATLGGWDSSGVPAYLISGEQLSPEFLTVLNSVLPEAQPVPDYNPQYLDDGAITNISIVEDGEVFVTFIHEGAGYKNALLFFTYNTASGAPTNIKKSDLTIIFPNVSYSGSGGGLYSGDRVKIGDFTAGTTICWALVANGFSNETVGNGNNTFYSVDELNKEDSPYNQHVVQIAFEDRVVISFEDLLRPGGDNDFNDAIFSVSSNPLTAIDTNNIITPDESSTIDSDGDGVIDSLDLFPNNANLSGVEYYPAEGSYGTLAYEDLWPHMGDYDFNDLVLDLKFEEQLNSEGDIVSIHSWFLVQGILASMNNGFAIELGVASDKVLNITGGEFSRGYIVRDVNGVEERQSRAVVGIFEDANLHFVGNEGIELEVTINFTEPVSRQDLGFPPYNPFIMNNGERGREVHLPGKTPTDLVHSDYFETIDDNSTFSNGNSYKTSTGHPWALNLPVSFQYPYDDIAVNVVYNNFDNWVDSEGTESLNWYLNVDNNINDQYLFVK